MLTDIGVDRTGAGIIVQFNLELIGTRSGRASRTIALMMVQRMVMRSGMFRMIVVRQKPAINLLFTPRREMILILSTGLRFLSYN